MFVACIRAEFHKLLVRIANREDPDQTASDLGLCCLFVLLGRQLVFDILGHLPYIHVLQFTTSCYRFLHHVLLTEV